MDTLTTSQRSANMARIRSRHTAPELAVRRLAHRLGFRFRLHRRDLPGVPDLTFPGRQKVIFVNGCFWHRHAGCKFACKPKSNVEFWSRKFRVTVRRDARVREKLKAMGWGILTVWECETKDHSKLTASLRRFLTPKAR